MGHSLQQKLTFSYGTINPDLLTRVDLDLWKKSYVKGTNCINSVFGYVKRRMGSKFRYKIDFSHEDFKTGSLSSDIGLTSDIQNFQNSSTSGYVGTNSKIFEIDYGAALSGALVRLRGLRLNFRAPSVYYTSSREFKQVYAGGGGEDPPRYAYVDKLVSVSALYPGVGVDASDSFAVIAPAGRWSVPSGEEPYWGAYIRPYSISLAVSGGALSSVSLEDQGGFRGSDLSVDSDPSGLETYDMAPPPLGFVRHAPPRTATAKLYSSLDGETWIAEETIPISETLQNFNVVLENPCRFLKLEFDAGQDIGTSLGFGYVQTYVNVDEPVSATRVFPYFYNNDQKYVFILSNYKTTILNINAAGAFEFLHELAASGLREDILADLNFDFNYDTIVLCHPELVTKKIRRLSMSEFEYSNFDFKNMITYDFSDALSPAFPAAEFNFLANADEGVVELTSVNSSVALSDAQWNGLKGQYLGNGLTKLKVVEASSGYLKCYTIIGFPTTRDRESNLIRQYGFTLEGSYEPIFSELRGWPRTCCFCMGRIVFGGASYLPSTLVASRSFEYENFKQTGNNNPADAFYYPIDTAESILKMKFDRGLHIFTSGNENTAPENSFTPADFRTIMPSRNGTSRLCDPVVLNGLLLYVEKSGKDLMSYSYDGANTMGYVSETLSLYSAPISNPVSLAAVSNAYPMQGDYIYGAQEDGRMFVKCIVPSQNVNAMNFWETKGAYRNVFSIYDRVFAVVERGAHTYIEELNASECMDLQMDSLSTVGGKIFDLEDFEGLEFDVYKGSSKLGTFAVENGTIDLGADYDGLSIGMEYEAELEGVLDVNGETKSRMKRVSRAQIETKGTLSLEFCGKILPSKTGFFDFMNCTPYMKDCRWSVRSRHEPFEIQSILLYMTAGDKR